jgi:hypothetical protein
MPPPCVPPSSICCKRLNSPKLFLESAAVYASFTRSGLRKRTGRWVGLSVRPPVSSLKVLLAYSKSWYWDYGWQIGTNFSEEMHCLENLKSHALCREFIINFSGNFN